MKTFLDRFYRVLIVLVLVALALMLLAVAITGCQDTPEPEEQIDVQASYGRPLVPYATHYYAEASEDHWAILVDLDDVTNYPHIQTNRIILKELQLSGALSSAKEWETYIGIATSVATTGVNIEWLHCSTRLAAVQFDYTVPLPEHGLNLEVVNDDLLYVLSGEVTTTVAITSETHLPSPYGTAAAVTATVEAGDLVLFLREVVTDATLHMYVDTMYHTE